MKTSFIFLLLLISSSVFGQDGIQPNEYKSTFFRNDGRIYVADRLPIDNRRNSLYFELAGSGGFGSFNYEWNFKTKNKYRWMLRSGISGTYIDKNNGIAFLFPVMIHGVYGHKHGLDIGIGQTFSITTRGGMFLRAPLSIGYRLEPEDTRIFYRFSYTPIVSYLIDFQWEHWGGITIGYKLNPNKTRKS